MNQPIISPMFIYLIATADNFKVTLIIVSIILTILFLGCLTNMDMKSAMKYSKRFGIYLIVVVVLQVFIPSKKTLLSMLVAQHVTIENVIKGKEIITDSVTYIINTLKK